LACLAETVVLAMSDVRRNYSIAERPPLSDAEEVFRLATAHGFTVAPVAVPKKAAWPKAGHAAHLRGTTSQELSL
jgi:hypothetical protein